jgi:hypothetical protein
MFIIEKDNKMQKLKKPQPNVKTIDVYALYSKQNINYLDLISISRNLVSLKI